MRISTCKIVKDNGQCNLCNNALETLTHIFLDCTHTKAFTDRLSIFIRNKVDQDFRDTKKISTKMI